MVRTFIVTTRSVFVTDATWLERVADFLIQSGFAKEIRFHGKKYPWFVSDVTRKDWNWLLNSMVYGHLFHTASDQELRSLKKLGLRWKVCLLKFPFVMERLRATSVI